MRSKDFIKEDPQSGPPMDTPGKLHFITSKLSAGEVTDPKTIDYIFKILNKPEIQQAVTGLLGSITANDDDVARFQKINHNILSKIIRKLPVSKEDLDKFLNQWASGNGFVRTEFLVPGSKGNVKDLISDPTAFIAFETFEKLRSVYKMPKKGTTGYGEFGLAMLSPNISLKAPGDIEVNGRPLEVKGNDARLYADEKTPVVKTVEGRGPPKAAGALNNVVANLLSQDQDTAQQTATEVETAFRSRGQSNAAAIISNIRKQGLDQGLSTLQLEWWKAGFTAYQQAINMPIMVIGFGQFLISDKAEDFVKWGCLPKTVTKYGYMFGGGGGQSRDTYPKIYVPGHNK
jgi:hypothetical protein